MDKQRIIQRIIKQPTVMRRSNGGFTYIGLLIIIAIMGVMLSSFGTVWRTTQQRIKEQQLLFVGNQFSRAISAYFQNSPGGARQFPKKLEDLLQDKRQPTTVRYLRKIFVDPITGKADWGLIKGADGTIIGVHSLSKLEPIKKANFGLGNEGFSDKKRYSDWHFIYSSSGYTPSIASTVAQSNGSSAPANNLPGTSGSQANNVASANTAATVNNPVAAPRVAPPYQVPPPQPLPPDPSADQRKLFLCQIMRSTDASTCARLEISFDSIVGATCMASANERFAICTSAEIVMLPPLAVQYK